VLIEALVPVRGLPAGKSRLAALLSPGQRRRLVRAMLADVVAALRDSHALARITIYSRDQAAAVVATELGVGFLAEPPALRDLSAALRHAQADPGDGLAGREALLIVPADVPLLAPATVRGLCEAVAGAGPRVVGLAPSRDGGTNGLLLRPASVIAPAYGPGSAAAHRAAAEALGAAVLEVQDDRWALDIDSPEDLSRLRLLAAASAHVGASETLRCLAEPGFPSLPQGADPSRP
jgi:2-phospho-L-lactate guanylyltransferase